MKLYHICERRHWRNSQPDGSYTPTGYAEEGFIHCSHLGQLVPVANRRFRGRGDLVILTIDATRLAADIVEENLEGGTEPFPHIYGELPVETVIHVTEFPPLCDGTFQLPAALVQSD